jgi:protein-L-isoaspartate(D-aspartate) O-methyltransferase
MMSVDRGNYTPPIGGESYEDSPQSIGFGQTISAPHMHAFALEYMLPVLKVHSIFFVLIRFVVIFLILKKEGAKVLDVGCGSGYLTAVIARLNPTASVYGIDYIDGLVALSEANIRKEVSKICYRLF